MGNKLERGLVAKMLGKSTQLGMCLCSPTCSTLSISDCRRRKNGWRKTQLGPYVFKISEKVDLEEPRPLIGQVYFGCMQRESTTKESDVEKIKSEFFAQITITDTEAEFNVS